MTKLKLAASNEVRIEKGVPIPTTEKDRAWPLADMEVGDSFSFDKSRLTALRGAIAYERRKVPSKKWMIRTTPVETRCWRIA